MDIKQVETFLKIIETGSFTAAAEHLGYAQSTVTGHISQLEQSLGVQLFERTSKTKKPTTSAMALLPYARQFVAVRKRAIDAMLAVSNQMGGKVVAGASETVCISSLAEPLAAFSSANPGVELVIRIMDCADASRMLRSNEIDFAFFTGEPLSEKGLRTMALRWETMALAYQPERFSGRPDVSDGFPLEEHYLVATRGCVFRTLLEENFKTSGAGSPHLMEVGSIQVVKNLCACNLGLAFLPEYSMENEKREGKLEYIAFNKMYSRSIATQIVTHENKALTPAMNRLIEDLSKNLIA